MIDSVLIDSASMRKTESLMERKRRNEQLDATSEERHSSLLTEEERKELLDQAWQGYSGGYDNPIWKKYKETHSSEIETILSNFADGVREEINYRPEGKENEDRMRSLENNHWERAEVMGVNLSVYFGNNKEDAIKTELINAIMENETLESLFTVFEKQVLFEKYKENTSHRYDY